MRLRVKLCRRFGHRWGPWERGSDETTWGMSPYHRTCRRCGESQEAWRFTEETLEGFQRVADACMAVRWPVA